MKKGFTVIELLTVLVLLSIFVIIVLPSEEGSKTPMEQTISIMEQAEIEADIRSLETYAKSLKSSYLQSYLKNNNLTISDFLSNSQYINNVKYEGEEIKCEEYVAINSDEIELYKCTVGDRGYYNYINGEAEKVSEEG